MPSSELILHVESDALNLLSHTRMHPTSNTDARLTRLWLGHPKLDHPLRGHSHCTWAAHTRASPLWMLFSPALTVSPQTRNSSSVWTLTSPHWVTDALTHGCPCHPDEAVPPHSRQPSLNCRHLPGSAPPNSFRIELSRKGKVKF